MSTSKRGFASLSPARRREIASMGGKAAHAAGTAHEYGQIELEAQTAGRKGGLAVSRDRAHMSKIGRRGAAKRALNRKRKEERPFIPGRGFVGEYFPPDGLQD